MAPQWKKKQNLTAVAKAKAAGLSAHKPQPGLLVTKELDKAIEDCKTKVDNISKECRMKNQKFRDIEFDLENDQDRCLYGLYPNTLIDNPADVQRVTQIFKQPQFFAGGTASSDDIIQGNLGDCWFLSALATISTCPGLVEKFCVARDEKIGVYGFIFFRDCSWVTVIIDDLLFTRSPKWEELTGAEQALYHEDKEFYNKSARKGGKSLYFARSGRGETWVPLIEKAYAKLHGSYDYLNAGEECEAIEDLTGGASTMIQSKDILDIDRFWKEELTRANTDRLFGCSFDEVSGARNGLMFGLNVQGLIGSHAYSVLRAVECKGKRFVVIRNPWGKSEWTGPWSDGSKEWTQEWLQHLPTLGHRFGDDGQFLMEYADWLEAFSQVDRTIFFDETWTMSSQYLEVTCPPLPSAWSYGEVSYKFSLTGPTKAVIVLSKLDSRYFRDLRGRANWTMDFSLVREGETTPIASSNHSFLFGRSVNLEAQLEAGTYLVYIRLDRSLAKYQGPEEETVELRKLSRIMTQRATSKSIVANFNFQQHQAYIPLSLEEAIDLDLQYGQGVCDDDGDDSYEDVVDAEAAAHDRPPKPVKKGKEGKPEKAAKADTKAEKSKKGKKAEREGQQAFEDKDKKPGDYENNEDDDDDGSSSSGSDSTDSDSSGGDGGGGGGGAVSGGPSAPGDDPAKMVVPKDGPDTVVIGLKVFTHKDVGCSVEGRLRTGCKDPNCTLCEPPVIVTIGGAGDEGEGEGEDGDGLQI